MMEAMICVETQYEKYLFSSLVITKEGIMGIDSQTDTLIPVLFTEIQKMRPVNSEKTGIICLN